MITIFFTVYLAFSLSFIFSLALVASHATAAACQGEELRRDEQLIFLMLKNELRGKSTVRWRGRLLEYVPAVTPA